MARKYNTDHTAPSARLTLAQATNNGVVTNRIIKYLVPPPPLPPAPS